MQQARLVHSTRYATLHSSCRPSESAHQGGEAEKAARKYESVKQRTVLGHDQYRAAHLAPGWSMLGGKQKKAIDWDTQGGFHPGPAVPISLSVWSEDVCKAYY
jgi:hypothetical protein